MEGVLGAIGRLPVTRMRGIERLGRGLGAGGPFRSWL